MQQIWLAKPATFKVTVKEIKVKELPELNDEFASEVSEFDTLDEYKKDVEKKLAEKKEIEANSKNEDAVVAKVVENATMEIPDKMIDAQAENMVQDMARRMQSQGLSLDMYLKYTGMTVEQMKDRLVRMLRREFAPDWFWKQLLRLRTSRSLTRRLTKK